MSNVFCPEDSVYVDDYDSVLNIAGGKIVVHPCADESVVDVPDIRFWNLSSNCFNAICPTTAQFLYQIDNSFLSPNKPDYTEPFEFEVDFKEAISIQNFSIYYASEYGKALTDSTVNIEYVLRGETALSVPTQTQTSTFASKLASITFCEPKIFV